MTDRADALAAGDVIRVPGGVGRVTGVRLSGPMVRLSYVDEVGPALVYLARDRQVVRLDTATPTPHTVRTPPRQEQAS